MKIKLIINPYANRWGAQKRVESVRDVLNGLGVEYDLSLTERPFQATELAKAAVLAGYDKVVAGGGDGTLNEVMNGVMAASDNHPTLPMGVLPLGTGNDFSDMNGLPRDIRSGLEVIVEGHTRQIDIGVVNMDGKQHYFDNNCALAMEPMVTYENIKMKRLSGNIRYLVAIVKALINLKAWDMRITWDGGEISGPAYLLSVCNGPRTGGMFRMAPSADSSDGMFDFVHAPEVKKLTVPLLVIKILRGVHIDDPRVQYVRTNSLTVHSVPPSPVHADGEFLTNTAEKVTFNILPGRMTLLSPRNESTGK